jgi:hypothetical protein
LNRKERILAIKNKMWKEIDKILNKAEKQLMEIQKEDEIQLQTKERFQ